MAERVAILASSPNPDVYFNVIARNSQDGVRKFVIAIVGMPGNEPAADISNGFQQRFNAFINGLAVNQYTPTRGGKLAEPIALENPKPMLSFMKKADWVNLDIRYTTVEEKNLRKFLAEERKAGAAFDVTACKNSAVAGAVAWLVSRGGSPIHTFEMKKKMSFGQSDLYPYLRPADFEYTDLSKSKLVRSATLRVNLATMNRTRFWVLAGFLTAAVATASALLPPTWSTPIFAAAATLASILSAANIFIRDPN